MKKFSSEQLSSELQSILARIDYLRHLNSVTVSSALFAFLSSASCGISMALNHCSELCSDE